MKIVMRRMAVVMCVAAAVVGIGSGTAMAHQKNVSHTCQGLSVNLIDYGTGDVNRVIVTINGVQQVNQVFGSSFSQNFTFANPAVNNTYQVVVTAWDDPTGAFGWTFDTGTTHACPDAPPPSTTTTTTVAATTTTTTTTAPAITTTTTTLAPGATTTTLAGSGGPVPTPAPGATTTSTTTTTLAPGAATTTLAGAGGPVPTATSNPLLPATGSSSGGLVQAALIFLCVGLLALLWVRRPRIS